MTAADIADAVWIAATRTTDGNSPSASNGSYIDNIGYAIWTAGTRELDGTPPAGFAHALAIVIG